MVEEDTLAISAQTWNKLVNTAKNAGYRDGKSDGHDSTFQNGFDLGYKEGLQSAKKIGFYFGFAEVCKKYNLNIPDFPYEEILSNKPKKEFCQICQDENLLKKNLDEILDTQHAYNSKILNTIQNKCTISTHTDN